VRLFSQKSVQGKIFVLRLRFKEYAKEVALLIRVVMVEKPIAHEGRLRPPEKNLSELLCRLAKYSPTRMVKIMGPKTMR
jgi:hypothetical protein